MKVRITYDDFAKLDVVTSKVLTAEVVEGADRLLKLTVDAGEDYGERTIVSGIRQWYTPEEMIGKTVIYLANLEPRTIRGVESQGMLLAAGDPPVLLTVEQSAEVAMGSAVR